MPLQLNPATGELQQIGLDYVLFDRAPLATDTGYRVPTGWLDTSANE